MTVILIASSVSDLHDYRIPNGVILSGWLTGLAFRFWQTGIAGAGDGIFCIAISIFALFPLFAIRAMGAGDVKLLSVISGYYGLAFGVKTVLVFFLLAGVVSLIQLLKKKWLIRRFSLFFRYLLYDRKTEYYEPERDGRDMVIPLAPVLSVAYYLVYFCR